ncbi:MULTISPECIES: enoyl-CoA hydratase-related protein [unclassified Photobacterium]|uniref:enoyl-CoA hydratase-related protein n=1 Tax=unclassified Photobacterium TaxID=2628852 RepID=UPI001EDC9E9E|nr:MULTISPECIES: enoyl-CoA hydratase-related protein [unclassified Photobacterium]MCG3862902.1 enoyl-CoA hydratase/isomerase family protein [Photobacterium sp. Ph6]MCG3874433.1 enoyl-CoA hydratase/isomerase family protein [Photobacterium sp. Ph5]
MITSSLSNHILTLTIDRPTAKNALNLKMYQDLAQQLERAKNDDIYVVIITGHADIFCSGNDIEDFIQLAQADNTQSQQNREIIERFMIAMIDCPVPIVAAVSGAAIGIGMTLLQHCDFIFASPNTTFILPFVKLGLCPEFGSSLLLPQLIGTRKAKAMLLLGEEMTVEEALSLGFINQITIQPEQRAAHCANTLAALPKDALQRSKALLSATTRQQLIDCIYKENDLIFRLIKSPAATNALSRFRVKKSHT